MLTLDQLKNMPPHTCFAHGEVVNSPEPEGIYMVSSSIGRKLRWAALRGGIEDWVIVCHWADNSLEYVKDYGDKITTPAFIRKLVPCTDEAFSMYRD